jgi:LysM repeat protein
VLHLLKYASENVRDEMQHVRVVPTIALLLLLSSATAGAETIHTMGPGDTLFSLARRYGVTAEAIQQLNGIDDPRTIQIGARIRIPTEPSSTYTVQPGEYPYMIAEKLGVNWLELLAVNNLGRNDVVQPGDVLVIPGSVSTDNGSQVVHVTAQSSASGEHDSVAGAEASSSGRTVPTGVASQWPHPGPREVYQGEGGHFPGITMQGEQGDEFQSISAGVVKVVAPYGTFGRLILVESAGGYLYAYAGAEEVNVRVGDRVAPGTILGSVGYSSAFQSTKVLLAVWHNNTYIDPGSAPRG